MLNPDFFFGYLLLAIVVTILAVWISKQKWVKWIWGIGLSIAFWAFGHIDDVLGAKEHRDICEKEAGFRVFKSATLPKDLYDEGGRPKFLRAEGPDEKALIGYIRFESGTVDSYSKKYLKIDKYTYRIVDARTGDLLAENIDFAAWPSPFIPSFPHVSAKGCFRGNLREESELWQQMYRKVFGRPS